MKKSDAEAVFALVGHMISGGNWANEMERFMAKVTDVPPRYGCPRYMPFRPNIDECVNCGDPQNAHKEFAPPPVQPTGDAQELAILRELRHRCEAQRITFFYLDGGTEPSAAMQSIYSQLNIYNVNFRKPQR